MPPGLGLPIVGGHFQFRQKQLAAFLEHFGSLSVSACASVEELLSFVSRSKALRLVSSLRIGAVALKEERQSFTIDDPEPAADLCSEMRFLDREWLRVILRNAKQQLLKIATVSQGSVNESLAYPREVFKPALYSPPTPSLHHGT
jgi:DNA repair protein RadC